MIVTWASKHVSLHALYEEVNWDPLETRHKKHRLIHLYKMFNILSPEYLSSLIPPTVNTLSQTNLPNAQNIQTVDSCTTQYFKSSLPSAIRIWNNLPLDVRTSDSVIIFKRKLNFEIKATLGISMQVIGVLRYFTPDYVQSVAHLTMISFRNASQIHLYVSVVIWIILITTSCVIHSYRDREQS